MIAEDRYCIEIIRQNQGVIAALRKVNEMILANHLDTCVAQAVQGRDKKARKKKFQEILEVFQNYDQ